MSGNVLEIILYKCRHPKIRCGAPSGTQQNSAEPSGEERSGEQKTGRETQRGGYYCRRVHLPGQLLCSCLCGQGSVWWITLQLKRVDKWTCRQVDVNSRGLTVMDHFAVSSFSVGNKSDSSIFTSLLLH